MIDQFKKAFASIADALAALPPQESGTAAKIGTAVADARAAAEGVPPLLSFPAPDLVVGATGPAGGLTADDVRALIRQHAPAAVVAATAKKRAAPKKAAAKKKKR